MIPNISAEPASNVRVFWLAFIDALEKSKSESDPLDPGLDTLVDSCLDLLTSGVWMERDPYVPKKVDRLIEILQLSIKREKCAHHWSAALTSLVTQNGPATETLLNDVYTPILRRISALGLDHIPPAFDGFQQTLVKHALYFIGIKPRGKRPDPGTLECSNDCDDCKQVNDFIMGSLSQEIFAFGKIRQHVEKSIQRLQAKELEDSILYKVDSSDRKGYLLEVSKTGRLAKFTKWDQRVSTAKRFLSQVGDEDVLVRIMGLQYPEVGKALSGEQPFGITVQKGI